MCIAFNYVLVRQRFYYNTSIDNTETCIRLYYNSIYSSIYVGEDDPLKVQSSKKFYEFVYARITYNGDTNTYHSRHGKYKWNKK